MQNSSAALPRRGFDLTSSAFLIVAFLTGIAGALQTPTLSLFLTNEVHVRPAMVGFFFTGSAVIGILVSQFLAGRSDRQGDRKQLIVVCCLLGVLACVLFAWNRNYFILLFVGVFLSSFGSTANPQMFALAREHADKTGREAVMFSSILRAQVSLAWVIGPPLAYALAMGVAGDAGAERDLHRDPGRYRYALFSGSDAGPGGRGDYAVYQYHARRLDHRRLAGGRCRGNLELSRSVLDCANDGNYRSGLPVAN